MIAGEDAKVRRGKLDAEIKNLDAACEYGFAYGLLPEGYYKHAVCKGAES
jgi:hypothetical protein